VARFAGALVLRLLLVFACQVGTAHAAWMIPQAPYRAKDFCVVKRDGWFHCFYILHDTSVPADSTERELGHAVSLDLYQWTQLPPVLHVRPGYWDNTKIWSPSILELDGVYYMFYTGVTTQPDVYANYQQIGLATSTDLMTWNRLDEPLLACDRVRWAYCDPLSFVGGEFRDPFVMKDPATGGWLMYYTARPASSPNIYVAGVAASSGDLTQWENREPLWFTAYPWSGSPVVESVHLFEHGGLYYLMFTGSGSQALRIATGSDPVGPLEAWTYRGTLSAMLGLDTGLWFASEHFADGTHDYLAFINYDRVDFREMAWGPGWTFDLQQPPTFHVKQLTWSTPEARVNDTVGLHIAAVNTLGRGVHLEAASLDDSGNETPVPLAAIGIPDSIPLPSPTFDYSWTVHAYPEPQESGTYTRLIVRTTDHTACSPPLTILPERWGPTAWVPHEFGARPPGTRFRALQHSSVGGPVLLVDLDAPATVRLELFDLVGRRVRTLADRELPAGATIVSWDGREESGAPARRGVYFARLTTRESRHTVRLLYTP